jgi:ribosomal protein S19
LNRGNALISVLLKKGMVGYNIGDFSVSKRMGSVIHKKKVKKKKKIGKKIRKGYLVNPIGFRLVFYGN